MIKLSTDLETLWQDNEFILSRGRREVDGSPLLVVALAAEHPVGRLILESPFTSAAAVGAEVYPYLPVRLLMRDQFRSDERIANVTVPVLVLHGVRDAIVPIKFGERLFALIKGPKKFVRIPEGNHSDLDSYGGLAAIQDFLMAPAGGT